MPRRPRVCPGGTCFHVLNRAVARLPLFEKAGDCAAFARVMVEGQENLVQLDDATGNAAEAARWHKELAARQAAEKAPNE